LSRSSQIKSAGSSSNFLRVQPKTLDQVTGPVTPSHNA
jgi:hypothetical protein